jgi:small conductance mechanosensitive channel
MNEEFFKGYPAWTDEAVAVVVALAAAYLLADVVTRLVRRALAAMNEDGEPVRASLRSTLRLVRLIIFLLSAALLVFPALRAVGMDADVGLSPEALGRWAAHSGLRVGLILLLAWLVTHVTGLVATRLEASLDDATTVDVIERAKRARTIGKLLQNTVFVLVSVIATLMVLREFNVDITPILTGAGIVGLAVGFGAQTLVKDVISGFFIILENQVRVGDVANIDGTGGAVERITLRTIVLRDLAGTVHVIPNGSIQRLSNLTKDFSYYVVDIGVAYKEDTDRVVEVMRAVVDGMLQEQRFAVSMLSALEVIGVDRFSESSVDIKVRIKTVPLKQWEVGREFLRRVKKAFDAEGIEIPFPYRTLVMPQGTALPAGNSPSGDIPTGDTPSADT